MSEQYRDNVQALCKKLNIENPIQEEVLTVSALTFYTTDGSKICIEGTDMNRAGRLFFQWYFEWKPEGKIEVEAKCSATASTFFAENWLDAEIKGRAMLAAFKKAKYLEIHWK